MKRTNAAPAMLTVNQWNPRTGDLLPPVCMNATDIVRIEIADVRRYKVAEGGGVEMDNDGQAITEMVAAVQVTLHDGAWCSYAGTIQDLKAAVDEVVGNANPSAEMMAKAIAEALHDILRGAS